MGFVYEEVGEENRELWESIGWKDWAESPIGFAKSREWSINRERQIYMQPIGRYIDMPNYHDLVYKGRIVRMEIDSSGSSGNRMTGFNMLWNIYRIYIPKSIWEEREEVLKTIQEAFSVYRGGHEKEMTNSISVEIKCEPECVEVGYNRR